MHSVLHPQTVCCSLAVVRSLVHTAAGQLALYNSISESISDSLPHFSLQMASVADSIARCSKGRRPLNRPAQQAGAARLFEAVFGQDLSCTRGAG